MSIDIPWLPPLLDIRVSHISKIESYLECIFIREFVNKDLCYLDFPVIINKPGDPNYANKLFKHLITRDNYQYEGRGLDIERAKRLLWCPAVIANSNDPNILNFDYQEHNGIIRTYLYLKPYTLDYLVILQKNEKSHEAIIISAYYIDVEYKRRSYLEKSKKAINKPRPLN
jgi:hypothetical protein